MEQREHQERSVETYPDSVRKLSESWRQLRPEDRRPPATREPGSWLSRYYLPIGLGLGVLLIAFVVVIGGLFFLFWNGAR